MRVYGTMLLISAASLTCLAKTPAGKETRRPSNQTEIQAQSLDPSLSREQLKAAGFKVTGPVKLNEIPVPEIRDAFFRKAGLHDAVAHLDQFDKDILFMRARRYTAERLVITYKKLPKEPLLRLQSLLPKEN